MKKRGRKKKTKDTPPKLQTAKLPIPEENTLPVTPKSESKLDDADDNVQEPEAGLEPAGPDQSLPIATEPDLPDENPSSIGNVSC